MTLCSLNYNYLLNQRDHKIKKVAKYFFYYSIQLSFEKVFFISYCSYQFRLTYIQKNLVDYYTKVHKHRHFNLCNKLLCLMNSMVLKICYKLPDYVLMCMYTNSAMKMSINDKNISLICCKYCQFQCYLNVPILLNIKGTMQRRKQRKQQT